MLKAKAVLRRLTRSRTAVAVIAATVVLGGDSPRPQRNPGITATTTITTTIIGITPIIPG